MTRERDENGKLPPLAHKRLDNASQLELAGVSAISADGRFAFLDLKRKLVLSRKAIDHVVDGAIPPPAVFRKDAGSALSTMADAWALAVSAVRNARAGGV